ncbi:MAG: polyhydroxyalkanoate depolymerase, partial [Methylibium sp.]|nr:polyhydroxyalkanoate depolymerase [Methylibium sp.]
RKRHYEVAGAGHYGIFSGRRWREFAYPEIREFILKHQKPWQEGTVAPAEQAAAKPVAAKPVAKPAAKSIAKPVTKTATKTATKIPAKRRLTVAR